MQTYQQTIVELTNCDPTEQAELTADSMLRAMLTPDEITAKFYVLAVQSLATAMQSLLRGQESPQDVFTAADGIRAEAEKSLVKRLNFMELQHRRYHPPKFTSTHDKPLEVPLMPELSYSITCDHKNSECLTVALGNLTHSDTVSEVVAPGESLTVSGRASVFLCGGVEPVLVSFSRVGGAHIAGTLAQPKPLPRLSARQVAPTPALKADAKPKRWFW